MINSENKLLKSVVDSKSGLHVTIYIKFNGDKIRFKRKLNQLLKTADDHLSQVLSLAEKELFLKPIRALGHDSETLEKFKGNIAIFRKNDFIRFINLPTEIDETCFVADTFHIKPLIKWAQQDQDFLLVGLTFEGASLYKGSQFEFKKIDHAIYPEYLKRLDRDGGYISSIEKRQHKKELQHTMEWLAGWVEDMVRGNHTTVFVAGNKDYVSAFVKNFKSEKLYPETVAPHYSDANVFEICKHIRALLRLDSRARLDESLKEFEFASKLKIAKTNIFQIAKAAIKGNVKKLIVAEDLNVFGKLDTSTGGVSLHPLDMDHEDDCLLDDLAQTVLLNGGEVVVAKRSEIPMGRPIVAVLYRQQSELYLDANEYREVAL